MARKLFIVLMCFVLLGTLFPLKVSAEEYGTYGVLTYSVTDGEITINGCDEDAVSINIPGTINGYPVKLIGIQAFSNHEKLQTVVIDEGLDAVCNRAFDNCSSLKSIAFPETLTQIDAYAFSGCENLESIIIPGKYINLNYQSFSRCDKLMTAGPITSNANIKIFGSGELGLPFSVFSAISSVDIPDTFTSIGDGVFASTGITAVNIPDTVTSIGNNAFAYTEIEGIVIPEAVTSIGAYAFNQCEKLKRLYIPENVTSIGAGMCHACTSLEYVHLPDGITKIEGATFENCWELKNLVFPSSLELIERYAFNAVSLENAFFKGDAPEIESYGGFYNCTFDAYYPAHNSTWTDDKFENYGGEITWHPWDVIQNGSGIETDPFQIETVSDLKAIGSTLKFNYVLKNDLDLSGIQWEPIGGNEDTEDGSPFTGFFNGNNHTIDNLTMSGQCQINNGLFGVTEGTIQNLILDHVSIHVSAAKIPETEAVCAGGIAGKSDGIINNCHIKNGSISVREIKEGGGEVGGIAGIGFTSDCTNRASVTTQINSSDISCQIDTGGIVGSSCNTDSDNPMRNCVNYGDISSVGGSFVCIGGIAGYGGTLDHCVNYGNVNGRLISYTSYSNYSNVDAGGIAGIDSDKITNCINFGDIYGVLDIDEDPEWIDPPTIAVAGILGDELYWVEMENCFNAGKNITADNPFETESDAGRILDPFYTSDKLSGLYSLGTTLVNGAYPQTGLATNDYNGKSVTEEELKKLTEEIMNGLHLHWPSTDSESYLKFGTAVYTVKLNEQIQLLAEYKGNNPDNFEIIFSDESAFELIELAAVPSDEENIYVVLLTMKALKEGEYEITLNNENLSTATHISVTFDHEEPVQTKANSIVYQAQFLAGKMSDPSLIINDFLARNTPAKLLVEAGKQHHMDFSLNLWKGVTLPLDAFDDPSVVVETVVEPKDIYSGIIMSILQASTDINFFEDIIEDGASNAKGFVDFAKDFMEEYHKIDLSNTETFKNMTEKQQKELLDAAKDWMKDSFPEIAVYGEIFKSFTNAFKLVDTIEEFSQIIANYMILANMNEYTRTVLKAGFDESEKTGNLYLQAAFADCLAAVNEDYFMTLITKEAMALGKPVAKYMFKKIIWEGIKDSLGSTVSLFMTFVSGAKNLTNYVFATDDINDAYRNLKSILDVEDVFKNANETLRLKFLDRPSVENAAAYLESLKIAYRAIDVDCDKAYDFVDTVDESGATWILSLFKNDDTFKKAKTSIRNDQNVYKTTYEHCSTAYLQSLLDGYNPFTDANDWSYVPFVPDINELKKQIIVECPTDIYVYDASGTLVASVVDGMLTNNDVDRLGIGRIDDAKIIRISSSEDYSIKYVGTDIGTMDITIDEFDENEQIIRTTYYDDVPLEDGKEYSSDIPAEQNCEYELKTENDQIVNPIYDTSTDQKYTAAIKNGLLVIDGTLTLKAEIPAGKTLSVQTEEPEGYTFINWVSSTGEDIFLSKNSLETSFKMPAEDIVIEAVFKSNESSEVKPACITVVLDKAELKYGESIQLTAIIEPENAENKTVTWSSTDETIVTVDNEGKVTGIKPGSATITATTANGLIATCSVRVLFTDVANSTQYFYEPVYWALDNDITVGAGGPGKFSPSASCTREQFVTFLWRQQGKPSYEKGCDFSDVPEDAWYYEPISWAAENGITTGLNDGTGRFGVGQACTREQCVTFLHRAADTPEPEGSIEFTDSQEGRYYYNAIKWAAGKGITVGLNDGTGRFGVGQKCTRGMLVTFLYRYAHSE